MSAYQPTDCNNCGAEAKFGQKFCNSCGSRLIGGKLQGPMQAPTEHAAEVALSEHQSRTTALYAALAALALVAVTLAAYKLGQGGDDPAASATNNQTDAERIAAYTDRFLSESVSQFTSGKARVRSYPTAKGSEVLNELSEGEAIQGRYVKGVDPTTRWLKLDSGGYVWDGNLADRQAAATAAFDVSQSGLGSCSKVKYPPVSPQMAAAQAAASNGEMAIRYRDEFVHTSDITMITLKVAEGRNYPTFRKGMHLLTCPKDVQLTGRLVRGDGGNWFKVDDNYFIESSLYEPDYHGD
jgi:hypothetical protein